MLPENFQITHPTINESYQLQNPALFGTMAVLSCIAYQVDSKGRLDKLNSTLMEIQKYNFDKSSNVGFSENIKSLEVCTVIFFDPFSFFTFSTLKFL